MVNGIESDTQPPWSLLCKDFGEDTVELPPARGAAD